MSLRHISGTDSGMTTLAIDMRFSAAKHVVVTADSLTVDIDDGRTISVPLAWYRVFCMLPPKNGRIGA